MSFTNDVKNELCRIPVTRKCCALSEAYGLLLYGTVFSTAEIRLVTSSPALIKRIPMVFGRAFGFMPSSRTGSARGNGKTTFFIDGAENIKAVFNAFGYEFKSLALHLNRSVIDDECCRFSFVRGAFLSGGSIAAPQKKYHLELATSHYSISRQMLSLLSEFDLSPKASSRKGTYVIYIKDSVLIEDFLTMIGAQISAMAVMQAKVEKGLRNAINRQVNCETANLMKTVDASMGQISAIRRIGSFGPLEKLLPEPLLHTALVRLENPELTLSELALKFDPPLTKSGLSHRLKKIGEISQRVNGENK